MNLESVGKIILALGLAAVVLGGLFLLLGRVGIERLPGDLVFRGEKVTVYLPLGLSILASVVLTVVLNLLFRR
ncbi:MAG: hypothetical protein Kow00122_00170 [Thermoleophilia bacterium]